MSTDSMSLPEGLHCVDCQSFERCQRLGILKPGEETQVRCDWSPSRFAVSTRKYIEARKALAAARPKWIDCRTEMPDAYETVLIAWQDDPDSVTSGYHDGTRWNSSRDEWCNVSHWMRLPEPPVLDETGKRGDGESGKGAA